MSTRMNLSRWGNYLVIGNRGRSEEKHDLVFVVFVSAHERPALNSLNSSRRFIIVISDSRSYRLWGKKLAYLFEDGILMGTDQSKRWDPMLFFWENVSIFYQCLTWMNP